MSESDPQVGARRAADRPRAVPGARRPGDFDDPRQESRRLLAELVATFALVLVAAGGAVVAASTSQSGHIAAEVAPGLLVMAMIYAIGEVSGAHLNPAITLLFAIRGDFPWRRVPGYLGVQFAGALLAAALLRLGFGLAGQVGATTPGAGMGTARALVAETLLTCILGIVVVGVAHQGRVLGGYAGIAVGGFIAMAGLLGGPVSGGSMNPARSIAPDVVRWSFSTTWIYIVGPLLGCLLAAAIAFWLDGARTSAEELSAQGEPQDA